MVRALFAAVRALGPRRASDLGGWVGRALGPRLPVSRIAEVNLRLAFPDRDAAWRRATIRAMWDNLGRVAGELPTLPALMETPGVIEVEGAEPFDATVRAGGPAILFSGHFANWEIMTPTAARRGARVAVVYRAIGNPLIDTLVASLRQAAIGGTALMLPKGAAAARATLAHLRDGGVVGMLMDQKMNDGIEARLFGMPAMTAPALAHLALRFRCPVIPTRAERLGPARFRVVVEPPLPLPDTGDRHADIAALTQAVNDTLERWIRDRPAEWLWLHRRFDKALYRRGGLTPGAASRRAADAG
ncbi:LpxL/LpxP family acyltransferase [Elioraea sp.]|uniref:LpxL/LpxP family acyltransferase n=1 Tax=Elioraea sp. TaxID=2185103 RepID=UPI003F6F705B